MDKNKKYQILKYSLLFLLFIFSSFLWRSVSRAIFVDEASVWMAPIVWSFLFFIILALVMFLVKERKASLIAIAFSFLISLIYSFSIFHLLILGFAMILVVVAQGRIREDLRERLKINLGRSIRVGSTLIILALSLTIASQYYFQTKDLAMEKYLPHFEVGKSTSGLTLKLLSSVLPQAKDLGDPEMTVDQFLLSLYAKQKSSGGVFSKINDSSALEAQLKELGPAERVLAENIMKNAEDNLALIEGRKQLSQLALREVKGDEKTSDVFSEIVNIKINNYFMPSLGGQDGSPAFSAIIAIIIFLTVYSLGSFLRLFWIPLIKMVFFMLKKSSAISVALVPTEKEIIE